MTKMTTINQYKSFINTPNLWSGRSVLDLKQFEMPITYFQISNTKAFNEMRLGKRVEQFFDFQVQNSSQYEVLQRNVQIKNDKITFGELDMLLLKNIEPKHIEIVYKFYLYDTNIKSYNELDKWIGPNRKDTLIYKLNKLKTKQLPLLYSKHCKSVLKKLKLNVEDIKQEVSFKAQLFMPFNHNEIDISPLNNDCICGFYLSFSNIEILRDDEFYIPQKLDWLIEPIKTVNWMNFKTAVIEISGYIHAQRSPMIWIKQRNQQLKKCFITFW